MNENYPDIKKNYNNNFQNINKNYNSISVTPYMEYH